MSKDKTPANISLADFLASDISIKAATKVGGIALEAIDMVRNGVEFETDEHRAAWNKVLDAAIKLGYFVVLPNGEADITAEQIEELEKAEAGKDGTPAINVKKLKFSNSPKEIAPILKPLDDSTKEPLYYLLLKEIDHTNSKLLKDSKKPFNEVTNPLQKFYRAELIDIENPHGTSIVAVGQECLIPYYGKLLSLTSAVELTVNDTVFALRYLPEIKKGNDSIRTLVCKFASMADAAE